MMQPDLFHLHQATYKQYSTHWVWSEHLPNMQQGVQII